MNHQLDDLAKGLAQSVTRRGALKKFGIGLVGVVLASLGLTSNAHAGGLPAGGNCLRNQDCTSNKCNIRKYRYQGSWVRIGICA